MTSAEQIAKAMYEGDYEGESGNWDNASRLDRHWWISRGEIALAMCGDYLPVGEPPELE